MTEYFSNPRAPIAWLVVCAGLAVTGCAAAPHDYPRSQEASGEGGERPEELSAMTAEVVTLEQELALKLGADVQGLATGPTDCQGAAELRDRICELSERICRIAEQNPSDGPTAQKCDSARNGCIQARADVAEVCAQ